MAELPTLVVRIIFTLLLGFITAVCSFQCGIDQFEVEDVLGNLSCINCPRCPPGAGLTPECGSYVKYGTNVECKPCQLGVSYSTNYDTSSCRPCGICSEHQYVITNCTLKSNSKCNHSCTSGFYFENLSGDCQPCSWCCHNKEDSVKEECKDMPYYKQCDLNQNFKCQPRCQEDQYIKPTEKGGHCITCYDCPAGFSPSPPCGSIVETSSDITCKKCIEGLTFSDNHGKSPCKVCSKCSVGQKELRPCNATHNRLCGDCDKGFYSDNVSASCKPCSACCNDNEDVHIQECAKQNMPQNKQCSYTQRAVNVCQQKNDVPHTTHVKSKVPVVAVVLVALVIITGLLVFYLRLKCRKLVQSASDYHALSMTKLDRVECQTSVEYPIAHGSQETLSFDKSGVMIQFLDPETYLDYAEVITVEISWSKSACPALHENEVQLSPVIKFHPHGLKLSKKVQVRIPHSAFLFFTHGWALHLKSSKTEQQGKVSWKETEGYKVHSNELSFMVDSLLSFVVVGKAVSFKPTKKRLQCAVFGGEGKVGMDYKVFLYVFDDCEASLEKIMKEEKVKDRILLGSIQSMHVECIGNTDIHITVQQPVHGWIIGEITPQLITHKSLKESYQTIPRSEITFKHDKENNRDFMCTFELTGGDETTTVCVVASIKEDPLRRLQTSSPVHHSKSFPHIVTGRSTTKPVIINEESPSPCFLKLPEEVLHSVAEKLDTMYLGVGNWRHVATQLGFTHVDIEDFGRENLSPDGSPSAVMLQVLQTMSPQLTVTEFVHILQTERVQRYDVVDILRPYLYELESGVEA